MERELINDVIWLCEEIDDEDEIVKTVGGGCWQCSYDQDC